MLPGASTALPPRGHIRPVTLAVDVPVNVGIAVDVDVDIPTAPVATTPGIPPCRAQRDASGKGKCRRSHIPGGIIHIGWIGGIRPGAIHHCGVVRRDVHHLGIGRFDLDHGGLCLGLLDDHRLLFRGLQVALRLRPGAESLDGIQHVLLLRQKRVAEPLGHVELLTHHGKYLGKVHQRLHTRIPVLCLQGRGQRLALQRLVRLGPPISLHHLQGIRGSHQDL